MSDAVGRLNPGPAPDEGQDFEAVDQHGLPAETASASGRAVRRGAWWGIAAQGGQQALSTLATVVLARLLAPQDFGIIAVMTSLIGLAQLGLSLGWGPSVVRRPQLTDRFLSSLFWAATATALVAGAATVALAEPLSSLLGVGEATPYLRVLALALVLQVAATVPAGLLMRTFRYARYYLIQLAAMAVYVAVQIVLATTGMGAWSVVVGQIAMAAVIAIGNFIAAGWIPRLQFHVGDLRGEMRFAGGVLGLQAANYGVKNVDYWVVGNVLGAASLGAYYLAFVLPSILRLRLTSVSRRVLLPVFARTQGNLERRRQIYIEVIGLQLGLAAPAMAGVAVLASPIVALFFGGQWGAAVEPLRWIAIVAMVDTVGAALAPVVIACGELARATAVQTVRLVATGSAVLLAGRLWGTLEAVAIAVLVATLLGSIAQQFLVADRLDLPFRLIRREVGAILATTAAAAGVMFGVSQRLEESPEVAQIVASLAFGALAYVCMGRLVFPRTFRHLIRSAWNMVRT